MVTFERIRRIPPLPAPQDILEKAFKRARKKEKDSAKIDSFSHSITHDLNEIVRAFPSIDRLPKFYQDLIEYTIGTDDLKKALANVGWVSKKISQIAKKEKSARAVFGRASSLVKKLNLPLNFLNNARREMYDFPVIKDMFSVCITGFPNVGKTTLLSLITKSIPEIKPYPFTTKRINLGYLTDGIIEIQFLDTPGTLNRLNKMNKVELQSFLAMRNVADLIVVVIDPTLDIKKQIRLLVRLESFKKPIIIFVSKMNLFTDNKKDILIKVEDALNELGKTPNSRSAELIKGIIDDKDLLKKKLIEFASSYYHKLLTENS